LGKQEGVEIAAINGGSVILSNGRVIEEVDAVLLGTGYGGPKYHPNLDMHDDTPYWAKVGPLLLQRMLVVDGTMCGLVEALPPI
jgi:hypothetical protein